MDRHPVFLIDPRLHRGPRILVIGALALAIVVAAWQLRFLCDDAFITFRYVSNAHDGLGLVWNAPPFRPVEGYTGFLWALLLWATWSWFGVEPPDAANVLSIAAGVGLFLVCAKAAMNLRGRDGTRLPDAVGFVALAVLASNRTFLQWMTGGLETALFNLAFVGWVLLAFRAKERRGTGWLLTWSTAATVAALTRPDGLLPVAATAATAVWLLAARRCTLRGAAIGLLPLLAIGAHVLWRHSFYGEWLPNTYYAKITAPWPEAGWRYLYCFAFEHGAWLWPLVALVALVVGLARRSISLRTLLRDHLPAVAVTAAVLFHVGYYVLRVGGDHFEYRVLSHTIPLGTLATAAMVARLGHGARLPIATLLLLGLLSSVAWLHWALTRPQLVPGYDALSDKLPAWAQPLARDYDRHQAWLQMQFNCVRTGAHQISANDLLRRLPPRARGQSDPDDIPVVLGVAAGIVGWTLPDIAVLDVLGLSDWVAARTPTRPWNLQFLPREVLEGALDGADPDQDGRFTRDELQTAIAAMPGSNRADAAGFVDRMFLLFGGDHADALSRDEVAGMRDYFAHMRFLAHERIAPDAYTQAFDANVTIVDRQVVVRKREVPLTPERVRQIETQWRQRVRDEQGQR
jgi:arabinofuranosyltransferase